MSFDFQFYVFWNFNVLFINQFQWLILVKGQWRKTFDVIACAKSVFLKFWFGEERKAASVRPPTPRWVHPRIVSLV